MHPDVAIDWNIPPTAAGWSGRLERFMGPGKSRNETIVELVGGALGMAAVVAAAASDDTVQGWTGVQIGLGLLLALDLVGGVLTNATNSAKRWYHRPGPGRSRARLGFVATHILHLTIVAFVLLPGDTRWWWTQLALLLISAAIIEAVPIEVKRPTATAALLIAVLLGQAVAPLPGVLAIVPVLFHLKLLLGHLVPEAPMISRSALRAKEPA